MPRHTIGRHRASHSLTRALAHGRISTTSALSLAASGGLLASSVLVASALPPTDAPTASIQHASVGATPVPDRASTTTAGSAAADTARAVAAPADAENAPVGELGFVGVTPEPEVTEAAAAEDALADTGSTSAVESRDNDGASRSEGRDEAPEPAPEPEPEPAPEPEPEPAPAPPSSGGAEGAIGWAHNHLGLPYAYGSDSGGGYDCSGFVRAAYASVGVSLPHGSSAQYSATSRVSLDSIQRGDLLFYSQGSGIYHVAIYLGDGQVIHSLRDWSGGFSGSKITGMHYSPGLFAAGRP